MSRLLKKGFRILRDDGVSTFVSRTADHFSWRFNNQSRRIRRYLKWKVGSKRGYITLSVNGIDAKFVALDKESIYRTINRLYRERDEVEAILQNLNEDDVFYDIGANTGLYTCFASQVCSQVVAFEPYPPNLDELEKNAKLNQDSITIVDKALSNETTASTLSVPDEPTPGHGTAAIEAGTEEGEDIETVRGDEYIQETSIPMPNIVKIDVEGAEFLVIDGLEDVLSSDECRLIYCEVHLKQSPNRPSIRDHGDELSDLHSQLRAYGFDVEQVDKRHLIGKKLN